MKNFCKISLLATVTACGALSQGQSLVSFVWKPPSDFQTVPVGANVTVALWAMPGSAEVVNISGFEAVVAWNKTALDFLNYTPFAQPNNSFIEGNGNGDVNMFDFNPTFAVLTGGTHLGDFQFKTLAVGTTEITMVGTATIQSLSGDFGGQTIVYRLDSDGGNFVPDYSSKAKITISPVPEPGILMALSIGLLIYRKRRA